MRDTFVFYRSFYEAINDLDEKNQNLLYKSIIEYSLDFIEPKLSGIANTMFKLIKPQLDANIARYNNGKKGGRKNLDETKRKPRLNLDEIKPKANNNNNVNVNKNKDIFMLSTKQSLDNTSIKYQENLKKFIDSHNCNLDYESFKSQCLAKDYKYKNFKLAYLNWCKDRKDNKMM